MELPQIVFCGQCNVCVVMGDLCVVNFSTGVRGAGKGFECCLATPKTRGAPRPDVAAR